MEVSARKRRRGSDGWSRHRIEIERLYMEEDLTLKDVIVTMDNLHGFKKTEQAYKKKLSQWNISKNVPAAVIQEMVSIAERRQREYGKETQFYWHDNLVEQDKINRTRKRLGKGTKVSPAPAVQLKKHMRYRTPSVCSVSHDPAYQSSETNPYSSPGRSPIALHNGNTLSDIVTRGEPESASIAAIREAVTRIPKPHIYEAISIAQRKLIENPSKKPLEDLAAVLGDIDRSLDVRANLEILNSISVFSEPLLDAIHDNEMDKEAINRALLNQERLVGGFLFLFGQQDRFYLGEALKLCYISTYTSGWRDYTHLFKMSAPQVSDLEWPGACIERLLRLSLTFMEAPDVCKEAFDMLNFAIERAEDMVDAWTADTRLNILAKSQEAGIWRTSECHLLLSMKGLQSKPELWSQTDRTTLLKYTLRQQRWNSTSPEVFEIISEFGRTVFPLLSPDPSLHNIKLFFLFAKFLVDTFQASSTATAMVNNGMNTRVGDLLFADRKLAEKFSKWREETHKPSYGKLSAAIISHVCAEVIVQIDSRLAGTTRIDNMSLRTHERSVINERRSDQTDDEDESCHARGLECSMQECKVHRAFPIPYIETQTPYRPIHRTHGHKDSTQPQDSVLGQRRRTVGTITEATLPYDYEQRSIGVQPIFPQLHLDGFGERQLGYEERDCIAPISRDVSPARQIPVSPADSRRPSQASIVDERLRTANHVRAHKQNDSKDVLSVPNSPFKQTSRYNQEWIEISNNSGIRRSSAPFLSMPDASGGLINFTDPFGSARDQAQDSHNAGLLLPGQHTNDLTGLASFAVGASINSAWDEGPGPPNSLRRNSIHE